MLVAIQVFKNITVHRLLITRHEVPLDSYHHQITNDFEKLLNQEGAKNSWMIFVPIFLVFCMHIRPTRLLKSGAPNTKFDVDGRLRTRSISLDWDDSAKIQEVITMEKDNKDKKKDFREKNKQLKREKQYQKQVAKAKTCLAKAKTRLQTDQDANDN